MHNEEQYQPAVHGPGTISEISLGTTALPRQRKKIEL